MTYPNAIRFLYRLRWFGAKFGLTNTLKLAALAGNPQRAQTLFMNGVSSTGNSTKLDGAAYANNVTDKKYNTGGFPLGAVTGSNSVLPGTPRMFGIELSARF